MAPENRFHILCVCTGNVCRSPAAERLLSQGLGAGVEVSSAGTHALVGQSVSPPTGALLAGAGADPAGFTARRLTVRLLQPVDLVLALTRAHRGDVVELWPKVVRRTFTLKEFARLLDEMDSAVLPQGPPEMRLRAAVPLAASRRHQVTDTRLDDVIDPYQQSTQLHQEAFSDIRQAVTAIVSVIRPE